MAKYKLRLKAQKLRKNGKSINDICKKLEISKSTANLWCRNVEISEIHRKNLQKKSTDAGAKGRAIAIRLNREKRQQKIGAYNRAGKSKFGALSERELLIAGAALYWAEGAKTETSSGFIFSNSDPNMILLMKKLLVKTCKISASEITCTIQINKIHKPRINKIFNFWANLLNFTPEQFKKPYYIKTKLKKVYKNHDYYYGVLRLRVKKSGDLKHKILGLIEGLKSNTRSG